MTEDQKRIEEIESALKVIYTWASFDIENLSKNYPPSLKAEHVVKLCDRVLKDRLKA